MDLSTILKPQAVKVTHSHSSKKRLFVNLAEVAADCYGVTCDLTVEALLEREGLGPTGVGHGVALPHARIDRFEGVGGVFIKLEHPIDFTAVDRQPVDLVFCLLASQHAGVEHLKALALVSRTMRDTAVCSKLRSNSDVSTLHAILTETPASQAA